MTISKDANAEINWWLKNLRGSFKQILPTSIDIVLYSDASMTGWGAPIYWREMVQTGD